MPRHLPLSEGWPRRPPFRETFPMFSSMVSPGDIRGISIKGKARKQMCASKDIFDKAGV